MPKLLKNTTKIVRNRFFDLEIFVHFFAASKNETSVVDWSLKRIELNRNVIRMKIVQAYIMHHRLERLRNKDYFKK